MYQLIPHTQTSLDVDEVIRRLRSEFAVVEVDRATAVERARAQADRLEQAPAHMFFGHKDKALRDAEELRKVTERDVAIIEFGDNEGPRLSLTVMPHYTIGFSFRSTEDQEEAKPLIDRCGRLLDCEVVLV